MKLSVYKVIEVRTSKEWNAFHRLPERIYFPYPHLAPIPSYETKRLLDTRSNPFFSSHKLHPYLCLRDGIPVARATLHIPTNRDCKTATFGFFESCNDYEACDLLFNRLSTIARQHSCEAIEGPYNPSFRSISGIQLSGFDYPSVFTEPCSPPYYQEILKHAGLREANHGYTWMCDDMSRFRKGSRDIPHHDGYAVRYPKRTHLPQALRDLSAVTASAFSGNGPAAHESDLYAAQWLLDGWNSDAIAIVYHNDAPVGAIITVPDIAPLNKRYAYLPRVIRRLQIRRQLHSMNRLVFFAIAMREEYRNTAATYLLAHSFQQTASKYHQVHSSWISSGNHASERMARRFGLEPWKKFSTYTIQLQPSSIQNTSIHHAGQGERHETHR